MKPDDVRALRTRNGWTQRELASRLGTDSVTVSRWERNISRPRPSAQMRMKELNEASAQMDIMALVQLIGVCDTRKVLKRSLLLSHRLPRRQFAANPTQRLKQVQQAQQEQFDLKARTRLKR